MSNQTDHTIVRLRVPPELKKKIEESAEQNNRSQSAEMVARLEKSYEDSYRENFSDAVLSQLLEGTVSKLLLSIKNQGVPDNKIQDALKDLTNKKAP